MPPSEGVSCLPGAMDRSDLGLGTDWTVASGCPLTMGSPFGPGRVPSRWKDPIWVWAPTGLKRVAAH